jgi:hypothetical protein
LAVTKSDETWGDFSWRWGLTLSACLSLGFTLYFAWIDRVAAGTLTAGFFVVLVLMRFLPEAEIFKAYGSEIKLRERLNRADQILGQMRNAAVLSGKLTYHMLGWQSRMANPVAVNQALADEADKYLLASGVTPDELKEIKRAYMKFMLYDIQEKYAAVCRLAVSSASRTMIKKIQQLTNGPEGEAVDDVKEARERQERLLAWQKNRPQVDWENFDFTTECAAITPTKGLLDDKDQAALDRLSAEIKRIADECVATGRVTDEAVKVMESDYSGKDLGKEYFGRNLEEA